MASLAAAAAATPLSLSKYPKPTLNSPPSIKSIIRFQTLKSKRYGIGIGIEIGIGIVRRRTGASGSSSELELTSENVNAVLDDVRPYLISDGGDVQVVSVVDGVVSLKLQGACETCPSSTTTMKMGIERRLKEKFGDVIKDVCQVFESQPSETSVEAVNNHLDILRPAIKNFGGSVEVLSVEESGECIVKYNGPASIGSGVRDAIKEKFPDILTVILTESS